MSPINFPSITIEPGAIYLGSSTDTDWYVSGARKRLVGARVFLSANAATTLHRVVSPYIDRCGAQPLRDARRMEVYTDGCRLFDAHRMVA